ncbi:hypothetical protein FB451DRAFT_1570222 [Mycena latifolia]|nr:hypothetical protein FB451DRAFT_1570222 [Mycena latifolia]
MKVEIGTEAWQFEDATRISRMLSPKKPKTKANVDLSLLDDYDCMVDEMWFQRALDSAKPNLETTFAKIEWPPSSSLERKYYPPLANFLNACVKHGTAAIPADQRGVWYEDLLFVEYDKEMGDGVGGARALKPDLGGVKESKPSSRPKKATLYWSPPDSLDARFQMQLPVEVKNGWLEMVSQAATYARCLFSANPSRTFALVLAYHQVAEEFRFLIFHRGGLTSHVPFRLSDPSGRTEALRLIMTLLLWSEPHHAGLISTSNNFEYLIPKSSHSGKDYIRATVMEVLHNANCVRGRATRVSRLSYTSPTPSPPSPPSDPAVVSESQSQSQSLLPKTQSSFLRRSPRITANAAKANSPPATGTGASNSAKPVQMGPQMPRSKLEDDLKQAEAEVTSPPASASDNPTGQGLPIHPRSKLGHELKWAELPESSFTTGKGSLKEGNDVILKSSWQVDSRKQMESTMYQAADGSFGTPTVICSYEGVHCTGEPISNRLFLPSNEEIPHVHWDIFAPKADAPAFAEARTLCYTIFETIGFSLVYATSSYQLCMAFVHALLGWLSFYQSGFLHRDISIGNVLLAKNPWTPNAFQFATAILTATLPQIEGVSADGTSVKLENLSLQESDQPTVKSLVAQIEILMVGFLHGECTAFVTDGDMAARWKTYFQDEHQSETRSVTVEFISYDLHYAMVRGKKYLHSPVDDLESFFWLACWAVLFNVYNDNKARAEEEIDWQRYLKGAQYNLKTELIKQLHKYHPARETSPITTQLLPVLKEWEAALSKLNDDWGMCRAEANNIAEPADFYTYHFHLFALRGVKDFLTIAERHRERLRACTPF